MGTAPSYLSDADEHEDALQLVDEVVEQGEVGRQGATLHECRQLVQCVRHALSLHAFVAIDVKGRDEKAEKGQHLPGGPTTAVGRR